MIDHETRRTGRPPTNREIGALFGFSSTNAVADHLKALQRKGALEVPGAERVTHRGLRLTEAGRAALGLVDPITACLEALHRSPL
jgi:SOS-response transcriptional repressor LexA